MGFFSRTQREPEAKKCDMCESIAHDHRHHIVQISDDQPEWLPESWRNQAQGQFTFLCTRCNSYPDCKWPKDGGTEAGMLIHLGSRHHIGVMKGGLANQDFKMKAVEG